MGASSAELVNFRKELEKDRRDKISITRCLTQLYEVQDTLSELLAPKEIIEDGEVVGHYVGRIDNGLVGALRLKSDIALALLKKRMPDLKQIELSGRDGEPFQTIVRHINYRESPGD